MGEIPFTERLGNSMNTLSSIDKDRRLYVIAHEGGWTTLGWDVAQRRMDAVAAWMGSAKTEDGTPGTQEHYLASAATMTDGATFHRRTGGRCPAEVTSTRIGLEGCRVEGRYPTGETKRFQGGKSTGWLPCHLQRHKSRAHSGPAVSYPEGSTIRVIRHRR